MISRVLLLVPSFSKKEAFKKFMEFFNNTQVFHPMYSMLYTVNLGLCDYVLFSQIRSHMVRQAGWQTKVELTISFKI